MRLNRSHDMSPWLRPHHMMAEPSMRSNRATHARFDKVGKTRTNRRKPLLRQNVMFIPLKGKAEFVATGQKKDRLWGDLWGQAKKENYYSNQETTSKLPVVGKNGGASFKSRKS